MIAVFHKTAAFALVIAVFTQSCGSDRDPIKESGKDGADAVVAQPVSIIAYDTDCNETAYAKTDIGKEAKLHLKILGASIDTHSIGYLGATSGAILSFQSLTLKSATEGSFPVEVLVRNKALCKDAALSNVNCDLNGAFAGSKQTFDTSASMVFVFATPVAPEATKSSGLIGSLLGMLGGGKTSTSGTTASGGILGGLLGAITGGSTTGPLGGLLGGLFGKKEEAAPTNAGRCLNGPP